MKPLLRRARLVVSLVQCIAAPLAAQAFRVDDVGSVSFGRREGLPSAPILGLSQGRDGSLWIATQRGARRYAGSGWSTDSVPAEVTTGLVRTIVDGGDGTRFFVRHTDVLHYRGDSLLARIQLPPGATPNYSATMTTALGTVPTLVIGGSVGLFRLSGTGVERVELPAGFDARSAMVTATAVSAGSDALWVAAEGGVATLARGTWRTWGAAEGMPGFIDQVSPGLPQDSVEALAATMRGPMALIRGQWRAFGPPTRATRAMRVATTHGIDTWVGLHDGEITRSLDGIHWDTVDVQGRAQGSRVQVLLAVQEGLAEPTVYTAYRSGLLARFRTGAAGRLGRGSALGSLLSIAGAPDSDTLWFARLGIGPQRLPGFPGPSLPPALTRVGTAVRLFVATQPSRTALFVGDARVIYRLRNGQWDGGPMLPPGDSVRTFVVAATPGGRVAPVTVSRGGALVEQPDGRMVPWSGFPGDTRQALGDTVQGVPEIVLLSTTGLLRRVRADTTIAVPTASAPLATSSGIAVFHHLSGERTLWVATPSGLHIVRIDGGVPAFRTFVTSVDRIAASDPVRALRALPGGRMAIATGAGVIIVQPGRTMEDSIRVLTNAGEPDGLPSSGIMSFGDIDRNGRLWVNTLGGAGYVNLGSVDADADAPIANLELSLRTVDGHPIAPGMRLRSSVGSLLLAASLPSHHREEDTRYLIELDGVAMDPGGWSGDGRASLVALEAGKHVVSVRASDWRGQQTRVTTLPFEILPPWWRSGGAIVAYLLVLVGAWFIADRVRHRLLRQRASAAEASERRVAASEARFRRLFEDGGDPQLLVLRGAVWRANAAAQALLGAPDGAPLVGLPRDAVLPSIPSEADDRACEADAIANGVAIPVELRRTVIPLDDDTIDHYLLRDLREDKRRESERRSLETQLLQSQRLESLGTLAGGVAHDFNNVLTIIQANAELAERDVVPESDAGHALHQLLAASRRARDIVRQILTFSRRGSTARAPVRVSALVQGLTQMLRASFPPSVTVEVDDQAPDAWVLGDETQLQQMLLNLCTNAEYAMRSRGGGLLTLAVRAVEREDADATAEVSIRVSDTGVGIPASDLSRVFDPFYTTKPMGEGTGLGLSVLHGIVAAHAGRVTVESVVGKGTTFDVRLPRTVAPSRPLAEAAKPPDAAPFAAGMRVLVTDDEPAVALVVERILQEQGFDVTVAMSGKAALEMLKGALRFDALVTDQTMPGMRGDELARLALQVDPALRILLMSGYSATLGHSQMAAAGIKGFIEKPFTRDQFLVAIRKVLGDAVPAA